jgi:hypothetical protein
MKLLETIPNQHFLMSVFQVNEKLILKIEAGPYEQVYKFLPEMAKSVDEVKLILTDEFLESVREIFDLMHQTFLSQHREPGDVI